MPIQLENMATTAVPQIKMYNAKFFDEKLTGKGKKTGWLNEERNPVHIDPATTTTHDSVNTRKKKYTNGTTEVNLVPLNLIQYNMWGYMSEYYIPDVTEMCAMGTANNTKLYLDMKAHSIITEESTDQNGNKTKKLTAGYQLLIYAINNQADTTAKMVNTLKHLLINTNESHYYTDFTCNPMKLLTDIVNKLPGANIDNKAIVDYITDYELYNSICKRSEEWQTEADKILDMLCKNVAANAYASSKLNPDKIALNNMVHQLRYIEAYNIPLDIYRNIYNSLTKHFQKDDAITLCKQNLNLLLSDTLNNLNNNKPQLNSMPVNPNNQMNLSNYSNEQKRALTSTEPLILVQAGAGTGKSTVILGRIDYMVNSGVKPEDITVLSFTNAAADNITAKNPNVHSMTIARMIHTIYTENFSNHELSSIDTIINSLDIYFPNNQIAMDFKRKLKNIAKNESNGFTSMNNFVEYHYDDVIRILDTIKQTCLEMEIIICYQQIDTFKEPASIQSKYLIIDEVQDNSIFEFIYTLKYVDKHKESLFIVGDCSQTLYEFRASNPKALNVLEGSGVFATYQLQVNYRSNQEILDFANVALQNIEANQYAHIQLQANSLKTVTEQSFTDAVQFYYKRLNKLTDFSEVLPSLFAINIKPYLDAKLAAGEKVAFLAYTRNTVNKIKNILMHMYPDKNTVSIIPDKMYNTTIFSEFIKRYWNEVKFTPSQSIIALITQEIYHKLPYIVNDKDKAMPSTQKLLGNWQTEESATIASWQQQVLNNQMTVDVFMSNVKESMLQFEIRNNAIKQALLSARNEQNKQQDNVTNADFILSTVHSAKGLEFDNVVVIYKNENGLPEDKKRMYYVAFTRAMKSEFILAYDTAASPKIEADYNTIVKNLHAKYPAPNSKFAQAKVSSDDD